MDEQQATENLIPDYKPFPTQLLPPTVAKYVKQSAAAIGCDDSYVALPVLTALGAAIGNTRRLRVKRGWEAPPTLWTCVVGESGSAKSPAMKSAMVHPKRIQSDLMVTNDAAAQMYELQQFEHDQAKADYRKKKISELPPAPERPPNEKFFVQDCTVQSLGGLLRDNPRGLLLYRDELSGWFGSFNQFSGGKGADESHWLSMFDGDCLTIDRKGDSAPVFVRSGLVSVTGGIQPAILKKALGTDHRESGLAARLLMASPPRVSPRWSEAELDPMTDEYMGVLFDGLRELEFENEDEQQPQIVTMNDKAKQLWIQYFNEHQEDAETLSGDQAAIASKILGYAARFALLFHCIMDVTGNNTHQVNAMTMHAAIAIAKWFQAETERTYQLFSQDAATAHMAKLVEWIKSRHGGRITVRGLQRGQRKIKTSEHAEHELNCLVLAGFGEWDHGRRTSTFIAS